MRADGKRESLRQSMAWLHTWSGLLLGWLLYAVFFTGTLSYFRDEINDWMRPELHRSVPSQDMAERALERMASLAPGADAWQLELADSRHLAVTASWRMPAAATGRGDTQQVDLDAGTGEILHPRETLGGDFFYNFHFRLYGIPRSLGRWIVGVATMLMLVAIVSGVITHKRIFADFFTFRPEKGLRSWLDAHNAVAVLALPFHLVITFSGLLLLMSTLMPWGAKVVYQGDVQRFRAELSQRDTIAAQAAHAKGKAAALPASMPLTPIRPLIRQAQQAWPQRGVGTLIIHHPGTARATIELQERPGQSLATPGSVGRSLLFDGMTGEAIGVVNPAPHSVPKAFYNTMVAPHLGRFADPVMRGLLFLSGILGTLMVATGLVLFVVKRLPDRLRANRKPRLHQFIEIMNVGAIGGLSLATAAYFWSNRVLAATLADRSQFEIAIFFSTWMICFAHAALRTHWKAWFDQAALAALGFLLLPLLNWATGGTPMATALARGQWSIAGVDLAMLAMGSIHAYAAWTLHRINAVPRNPALASRRLT